jgi:hypothetical protein
MYVSLFFCVLLTVHLDILCNVNKIIYYILWTTVLSKTF